MIDDKELHNDELEPSVKTGGENDLVEGTSTEIPSDDVQKTTGNIGNDIISSGDSGEQPMTPAEISKKRYHDAQAAKEMAKAKCFKALKICIYFLGGLIGLAIAALSIYWAYGLSSIAEPIGGIKEGIRYMEKDISEHKININALEKKLNETRDQLLYKKLIE